ncbi:MAG TPA: hypothetical protein VL549_09795 [Gemmatimonadales bacterium]|nr:hypothetical protein [Gemmatimonadales bacterium]
MTDLHCHTCGGNIADPTTVAYRLPESTQVEKPAHAGACACDPPIVYGPPTGYLSWPAIQRPITPRNGPRHG